MVRSGRQVQLMPRGDIDRRAIADRNLPPYQGFLTSKASRTLPGRPPHWGNASGFCAHLEMLAESGGAGCCAFAASGKDAMPAIIAMRYRRRIGQCPCCVSRQGRTFKGDIQASNIRVGRDKDERAVAWGLRSTPR